MSIEAMVTVSKRAREEGRPNCYYWYGVWWRLHSKVSTKKAQCLQYSKNQIRLFWDMKNRPEHFDKKPTDKTDWQWSMKP